MNESIQQIKNELMIKYLSGSLYGYADIKYLPRNDELREFVCQLGFRCAFYYALEVDRGPHDITRKYASKDPHCAYYYAKDIDKGPHDVTREGASKDPHWKQRYIETFGK